VSVTGKQRAHSGSNWRRRTVHNVLLHKYQFPWTIALLLKLSRYFPLHASTISTDNLTNDC